MLRELFPKAFTRYVSLPLLGAFTADYEEWLRTRAYAQGTREHCVRALERIDRLLQRRGGAVTHTGLDACWRWYRRRDPNVTRAVRSCPFLPVRVVSVRRYWNPARSLVPHAPAYPIGAGAFFSRRHRRNGDDEEEGHPDG
jgi:hypothetical protein